MGVGTVRILPIKPKTMPVTSLQLPKKTIGLMRRNINRHLQSGRLQINQPGEKLPLELHIFPLNQLVNLDWASDSSSADGFLVFIGKEGDIHTAVEFFHSGKRFNYAHSITGSRVDELVKTLNNAAIFFASEPNLVFLSFTGHFLSDNVIIRADVEGKTSYYTSAADGLTAVTQSKLAADFKALRESRVM